MSTPTLKRVLRLDNITLDQTYYTDEGYLIDNPIVTSTGIFEYALPDGGIRRELRLPENVFDPESLASYEGKPIIITHDAGTVDKDNVEHYNIGTIMSKGYQDGDDVRAKIVIHDTDAMRKSGLKELSLGYSLDLDETPGVWKGQPYDAVQRNIRINHLALVDKARAGEQARLNIDSRDFKLKGAKITMSNPKKRRDGEGMTPEDFAKAIEAFKARRAARMAAAQPAAGDGEEETTPAPTTETPPTTDEETTPAPAPETKSADEGEGAGAQEQAQMVKDRRDRRDAEGDPSNMDEAMNTIAQQDEDIETLLGIIDAMCANAAQDEDDTTPAAPAAEEKKDGEEDKSGSMNADSVDTIVRTRVKLARIGDRLNMDGLDNMSIMGAKKAIVKKLKPALRLDGKSESYVNAAFDLALSELNARKDTNFQRGQMFNRDSAAKPTPASSAAAEARQKMIDKMKNGGNK